VTKPTDEVKRYYDEHIDGKIKGFIDGNDRIERAWATVERWAPSSPSSVLEIGCGIGDICWRMARRWERARVVGIDISPASIQAATRLFGSSRVSFHEGKLTRKTLDGPFDLILLMDVYEHLAIGERQSVHAAIADLLSSRSRIILSVPTPRHLAWLRANEPREIQPVDEDIGIDTLSVLARSTGTEILLYEEVGVWHEGDYAHAVLGRPGDWAPVRIPDEGLRVRLVKWAAARWESRAWDRSKRLAWVKSRL
jgi:SAM-dependent methyltransferase